MGPNAQDITDFKAKLRGTLIQPGRSTMIRPASSGTV